MSCARARRWALGGALCAVTALGVASSAWAGTIAGPTEYAAANDWSDCGDGFGGSERLTTVGSGPATGHALHEHRYCPTRPASVTYYFYAYDASFRNICDRAERPCDPAIPFGAYAAVTLTMEPGDFEPGRRCHADGCPVVAPLPAANGAAIGLVVAEAVDDTGAYGLTHMVRWDPTPSPEPDPAPVPEPPTPDPPASEPPGSEPAPEPPASEPTPEPEPPAGDTPVQSPIPDPELPAPGEPAPAPPGPDTPPISGPTVDPPPASGSLVARLRLG